MSLSIKSRLIILLATIGLFLSISTMIGTYALYSSNSSLQSLFSDRVVCLEQFTQIRNAYEAILKAMRQVVANEITTEQAARIFEQQVLHAGETWAAYKTTYITPDERRLLEDEEIHLKRTDAVVEEVLRGLKAGAAVDITAARLRLLNESSTTNVGLTTLANYQVTEARAEFEHAQKRANWLRGALLVAFAGTGVAMAYGLAVVLLQVAGPIERTTAAMVRLAQGDLEATLAYAHRRDEVGAMARAVEVFRAALVARRAADVAGADEQAAKTRRAAALDAATAAFRARIESMTTSLLGAANELEGAAQILSRTAGQTADQSLAVSSAAEQTSANVQTVAAAGEELAVSIGAISGQIGRASDMARRAAADAADTNTIVMGLADGAERIGTVINLISGIAAQTNLLALNATIEAARAGDAGRGFGVVASEVKALAEQTAKATETISGQVAAIQGETSRTVDAIQSIGTTVRELQTIAVGMTAAMEEQGSVTQEIVRSIGQAADGTQEVTINIGAVTLAAGETGGAAARVLVAATDLTRQSEALGQAVSEFLSAVQAA